MNPFEGGGPENKDGYGSIRDPFSAADDSRSKAESDKVLNKDPETEIVVASRTPDSEFRKASGAPEASMNNNRGTGPDSGRTNGVGKDPDVDVVDGVVEEDDGDETGKGQPKEEQETKENNYTWEEFSSRARTVIEFDRINDNNKQAVDDLESVGVRIRAMMDSDDNKDLHERNRGLRNALESVLNKIDDKRDLDPVDSDFLVGMGVSKDKIDEWTGGAKKNNENGKKNMNNETNSDPETEERRKKEAHIALERLIGGKRVEDVNVSDGQLFDAWVINYGGIADAADYSEAEKWKRAIEVKIQEKIQEEEQKRQETARQQKDKEEQLKREQKEKERVTKEKEEREKRERTDALAAEKTEREKEKREKQQRARDALTDILSDQPESDEVFEKVLQNWVRIYNKDAPGELKIANRYLEDIYKRRAAEKAEKDAILAAEKADRAAKQLDRDIAHKEAAERQEYKNIALSELNTLRSELKELSPNTRKKRLWLDRLKSFIDLNKNTLDLTALVDQAKQLEKEESAREYSFIKRVFHFPFKAFDWATGGKIGKPKKYDPTKWK